jgi:hypothetical protein
MPAPTAPRVCVVLSLALAAPAAAARADTALPAAADAQEEHEQHGEHEHEHDDGHVAVAESGLRATHPWSRAGAGDEALVFVELANGADRTLTLTGAASPAARAATLVGFRLADGRQVHEPIAELPLEAGAEIALAPFGLAIRLEGLTRPLVEGETLPVTLLTDAGPLPLTVAVEAADARQHDHAGHTHD